MPLDAKLKNNGSLTNTGETGYATGTLTNGIGLVALSPALGNQTLRVRARVTDAASNQGTSNTVTIMRSRPPIGAGWTFASTDRLIALASQSNETYTYA